jgi:hypothetical protein
VQNLSRFLLFPTLIVSLLHQVRRKFYYFSGLPIYISFIFMQITVLISYFIGLFKVN